MESKQGMKERIIFYDEYTDNVVKTKKQDYKIGKNYKWNHDSILYSFYENILFGIAYIFSFIYAKLFLRIKIENKKIIKPYKKTGYFIYGNHTQPFVDVFVPAQIVNKRFFTIASQANLGIPIIGKILPALGAIIIPDKASQMKEFILAIKSKINKKNTIVIYPEAHVWPYYTKIREFPDTAFRFQVETNTPAFCFTTTYYKRKNKEKPGIKIYVDGPFFPDMELKPKERQAKLCKTIYETMINRSKNSNYEYIKYKKYSEGN